jgi:hypothetical protein
MIRITLVSLALLSLFLVGLPNTQTINTDSVSGKGMSIENSIRQDNQPASLPVCTNATVQLNSDYTFAVGGVEFNDPDGDTESGSTYRWLVNDLPLDTPKFLKEGLFLPLNNSVTGENGETPISENGVNFVAGRWGQALSLAQDGVLEYPRADNLFLDEGTIEMWVALRYDGSDPVYSSHGHVLFHYWAGDDYLVIAQSNDTGILYAGGVVNGEWESAYGGGASTRGWLAGEWHHIAFTYSTSGNFMRFYVDGVLTADTNEHHYWQPAETGNSYTIGGSRWNEGATYWLDEVRLTGYAASSTEITAHARRLESPEANEAWLPTNIITPTDILAYEYTPAAGGETGSPCVSPALTYPGISVSNPQPPSTILAPGMTSFDLSVDTLDATDCAWALDQLLDYAQMTPFNNGANTNHHQTTISGLNPNPVVINQIYVRCLSHPDFVLSLEYRIRSTVNPSFPRTGNLWGMWEFLDHGGDLVYMSKIDLWLGADFTQDQVTVLRQLNPEISILTSINTVENDGLPEDYYLHDVNGNPIEVWPGSFRLNLTKAYVAEYQAQYAYQRMLDGGLMYDGVFFDNVMTTQSWLTHDIYGNSVQIDANEDGIADDPAVLDAAWKAGVFHEMNSFREWMPYAIVSSHSTNIEEPGIAQIFNGNSLGFVVADVLEGERSFPELWTLYHKWMTQAKVPRVTMFEDSPPDQIAYGYDYSPWEKIKASTLEFARTYYPWMRFGLALTLMDDGFFAYEYGDTWHGNDWWYDELDFDLGYPLGAAERVNIGFDPGSNKIDNPGFESPIEYPWQFWANEGEGCTATFSQDVSTSAEGIASARVDITATSGVDWHIDFNQDARSLQKGSVYDLTFWAKSNITRTITLSSQKNRSPWTNYGLWQEQMIGPEWKKYTVSFEANATVNDARVQFLVGAVTGTVWLDQVSLTLHPPDVFQREFTNGLTLLNGSHQVQIVELDAGYQRLFGTEAPRYETILDDTGSGFSIQSGAWITATIDSGEWKASGPFYHAWQGTLRELASAQGEAVWSLPISATDTYTLTAWWPAAPEASGWNTAVTYEVVANGQVVATATLDQTTGGDEWHEIAVVDLLPGDHAMVRVRCQGAPCVADALHMRSLSRYNDGSPARTVVLQPLDGIILQRQPGYQLFLPVIRH